MWVPGPDGNIGHSANHLLQGHPASAATYETMTSDRNPNSLSCCYISDKYEKSILKPLGEAEAHTQGEMLTANIFLRRESFESHIRFHTFEDSHLRDEARKTSSSVAQWGLCP